MLLVGAPAGGGASIRRSRSDLDRRTLVVEQMEGETLAAEIQTGVQHRNGPPLDSSQSTSRSVSLGRPFFMAFLTIEVPRRHARTRAIIRDTVLPANLTNEGRKDGPRGVARVVSDVSVLCPRIVVDSGNAPFANLAGPRTPA